MRRQISRETQRPTHPTGRAIALLAAVTILIVVLAAMSTF